MSMLEACEPMWNWRLYRAAVVSEDEAWWIEWRANTGRRQRLYKPQLEGVVGEMKTEEEIRNSRVISGNMQKS